MTASVDLAYGGFFGERVANRPLFKKKADRQSQKNRRVFGNFERQSDGCLGSDSRPASSPGASERASQKGASIRSSDQVRIQSGYFNVAGPSHKAGSRGAGSRASGTLTSQEARRTGKPILVQPASSYGRLSNGEASSQ